MIRQEHALQIDLGWAEHKMPVTTKMPLLTTKLCPPLISLSGDHLPAGSKPPRQDDGIAALGAAMMLLLMSSLGWGNQTVTGGALTLYRVVGLHCIEWRYSV